MRNELICVLSILSSGLTFSSGNNWTFLPQLQELCPYSTFCEENATMSLPENNSRRPCCESCSCKPGCEVHDNCCFDFLSSRKTYIQQKCTSPILSNIESKTTHYFMIHSCSNNLYQPHYSNETLCVVNYTDYNLFAPVFSPKTGDIYVNADCALCNNVYDIIPWQLAVKCPQEKADHSHDTLKLLQGKDVGTTGCFLSYVPPKHVYLESRTCMTDVIRECNVTGKAHQWDRLWDYCPMFNATFSISANTFYGNIFCFLCNGDSAPYPISTTCDDFEDYKYPTSIPFTAVFGGINFADLDVSISDHNFGGCSPTEALVHSYKTECRRVTCPRGQFRVGGKCGFYSKEWIGGPFTAVLKLIPLDRTGTIDKTVLSDLQREHGYDTKARWLKRNAMKGWNVKALYRPSVDGKYVEYLVAISSYPTTSVNPSRLRTILKRTLKETWLLNVKNSTFRLHVQLSRYMRYKETDRKSMLSVGIEIDEEYGYLNIELYLKDSKYSYLLAVYSQGHDDSNKDSEFLTELFLCDQIELRPDEFQFTERSHILFKITNETLSEAEYRTTNFGNVSICLNRFPLNKGLKTVHNIRGFVFYSFLFGYFTKGNVL